MKKLLTSLALIVGSAVAGLLVWRKVESDRQEDLWTEAEHAIDARDSAETKRPTEHVAR